MRQVVSPTRSSLTIIGPVWRISHRSWPRAVLLSGVAGAGHLWSIQEGDYVERVSDIREKTMMARISAVFALVFTVASLITMRVLTVVSPLDSLAAPNRFIDTEIELAAIVFVVCMALAGSVRKSSWKASLFGFLDRKIRLPTAARVAALLLVIVGGFIFAFFATIDDLGGYNGPGSSLAAYPTLRAIHNLLGLAYFNSWKIGTAAFFFFDLAVLGLIALLASRGLGAAIKDSITLFAAPALVIFELGLWYFAPEDLTWHVTMFLWIGGINDHGYRAQGLAAGVTYYPINNWLVLFVALFFVASRVPALWSGREKQGRIGRRGQVDELEA